MLHKYQISIGITAFLFLILANYLDYNKNNG